MGSRSRGGPSSSPTTRSPSSPPSPRARRASASPGSSSALAGLTPTQLRALAARHGIRPKKSLGQHFLIDAALARRIAAISEVGPGDSVVEVGAGLGSLTSALAATGAGVLAVEVDERLLPALREVVGDVEGVRIVAEDAMTLRWESMLEGDGPWRMVANLPYNVAVPVVLRVLDEEPRIERLMVMVQREVGERLAAGPGEPQFGAVSLRVAYRAEARVVRRVSRSVFWPQPNVDSVLVSLRRRPLPVAVDEEALWTVIGVAFGQRRKTIRNALIRLGISSPAALPILEGCGISPSARPEEVGLKEFGCLAEAWQGAQTSPAPP